VQVAVDVASDVAISTSRVDVWRALWAWMGRGEEGGELYCGGDVCFYTAVEAPKLTSAEPGGVVAVDVDEQAIYYGG